MELLVGCLAVLILTASIVDWLLKDEAIVDLRSKLQGNGEKKITDLDAGAVVLSANRLFCQLFDILYGERTWSWQRFSRSCFLSLLFVVFSILMIGFENTFLVYEFYDLSELLLIITLWTSVNLFADFISLQETRWILGYSREKGTSVLSILVSIDLMLTTAIYVLGFVSIFFGAHWFRSGFEYAITIFSDYEESFEELIEVLLAPDMALPFFISTFGTSIVWFLFVISSLLIRAMSQSSRVLKLALDIISKSPAPARTAAGIVAIPIVVIFCIAEAIRWFF